MTSPVSSPVSSHRTHPATSARTGGARRRPNRRVPLVASAGLVVLLALAGCSGGADLGSADSDGAVGGAAGGAAADAPAEEAAGRGVADADTSAGEVESAPDVARAADGSLAAPALDVERSVISTAVVSLRSDDAGAARTEVMKVVDLHRGQVSDEETRTDDDGDVRSSRLVLRIPAGDFAEAVAELEKVADLESSDKSSEDVSFEVIDLRARIRAQEQSLRRVEVLLERAQSIRDVVSIESQLTQRQAELESLKSKQAYLSDQTTYATVTVYIATTRKAEPKPETDESGFLTGLEGGWKALGAFATVLATILGALLPWLVVAVVLGWPLWLATRRAVRRRPRPAPLTE